MDTESNTCSELREVTARASRFSEQITQHRVMVAQLREYLVDNFDDLGEHAEPIAEIFYKIYNIITEHPELESQLVKKLEARGFQELQFTEGRRYIVRANNSAGRGIAAPETIQLH